MKRILCVLLLIAVLFVAVSSVSAVTKRTPAVGSTVAVRVTDDDENGLALRFTAPLSRFEYDHLAAIYGDECLSVGILVAPRVCVEEANGVFTRKALGSMVSDYCDNANASAYIDIRSSGFYKISDRVLTVAGSVYNFSAATRKYNPAFVVVAYIDVDTDGDTVADLTFYGDYDPNECYRVKDTMLRARPHMTESQKLWITALLETFDSEANPREDDHR